MSKRCPVVSVIVPVFNRLVLLKATVGSLVSQTLMESEFLLVDDNSQPDVWEYLQELPQIDQRFKVLRKPEHIERGCQSSRNLGLSLVRRSVEAAGGSVTVRNAPNGGAVFTIQIPCGPQPGDAP